MKCILVFKYFVYPLYFQDVECSQIPPRTLIGEMRGFPRVYLTTNAVNVEIEMGLINAHRGADYLLSKRAVVSCRDRFQTIGLVASTLPSWKHKDEQISDSS